MSNTNIVNPELSSEQKEFISKALDGNNILVDACIGSGKTTAIQHLCNAFPPDKKILYLTYNRLLKLDAQEKIRGSNTTVTNYHGFAMSVLRRVGVTCGVPELVYTFNRIKPPIDSYDVLILDEYQDIEQELADMLWHIKSANSQMQIIAVGDMMQKIYDKSVLNVSAFMDEFLGEHIILTFTKCFRLSARLAQRLGRIWQKEIVGVNDSCTVEEMSPEAVIEFLAKQRPQDILCLGQRTGLLSNTVNLLENYYPEQFNKKTVYASIRDEDGSTSKAGKHAAIFTTFDSSKGLERPICVIFDHTEEYWRLRIGQPQSSYEILRNIFCVAASRGKQHIIFVNSGKHMLLNLNSEEPTLLEKYAWTTDANTSRLEKVDISKMFQFKYREDVEACYGLLNVSPIRIFEDDQVIRVKNNDELIDLSPCIGIYQEAVFCGERRLDARIKSYFMLNPKENFKLGTVQNATLDEKILFLTALETRQERYRTQVSSPFVQEAEKEMICTRLGKVFSHDDVVQVPCRIDFAKTRNGHNSFSAMGLADVVKNGTVYELKFVSELTHEHFLQCACYMIALKLNKGILWNTRDNKAFQIAIPKKTDFLDAVAKAVTKRSFHACYQPSPLDQRKGSHLDDSSTGMNEEIGTRNHATSNGDVFAEKNASAQNSSEKTTTLLSEVSAELEKLVSKNFSYNSSLLIDRACPLNGYQEAHASLINGKELSTKLRVLVNKRFSPDKAQAALRDYYEEEIMRTFREIPVDVLSRSKSGIRVNALKDSGYANMWQIYRLGYHKLLAVNGIGPKNAASILAEVGCMMKTVQARIVSKPCFAKTPVGEKAIKEYCRYKWAIKVQTTIGSTLVAEEKLLNEYCSTVALANGTLRWIFTFSRKKKMLTLRTAAALQDRIANITQELVNVVNDLYVRCLEISSEDAWADYMKSPEEYNAWLIKNTGAV